MPKTILILAALLSLAPLDVDAETLTATWQPQVLFPGDRVTMRGPDGGLIEMVVEVPVGQETLGNTTDDPATSYKIGGYFQLIQPYDGYGGLTLPTGTKAFGTIMPDVYKKEASQERGPMDLLWDGVRQVIHPMHHTVEVRWTSLCTPDGTCLLGDGPRDEHQTSP